MPRGKQQHTMVKMPQVIWHWIGQWSGGHKHCRLHGDHRDHGLPWIWPLGIGALGHWLACERLRISSRNVLVCWWWLCRLQHSWFLRRIPGTVGLIAGIHFSTFLVSNLIAISRCCPLAVLYFMLSCSLQAAANGRRVVVVGVWQDFLPLFPSCDYWG